MSKNTCHTCAYYHQHYALNNRHIFRVHCGHCTFPKVKNKRPNSQACENYTAGTPDETAFATKEYLSKTLLEYVLNWELFPPVDSAEDTVK